MKLISVKLKSVMVLAVITVSYSCGKKEVNQNSKSNITVEYPEAYELSNIILALTPYGKEDKWEVRKNFEYYDDILKYFKPYSDHALLDSANYSRKLWKEYLSFRTDAYAFEFNENDELVRTNSFYTNNGVTTFDDNLELINDFVKLTNFRAFFKENKEYRDNVLARYNKEYYINEMQEFLIEEFGDNIGEKEYRIILSPFVYRMNCHRNIDSVTVADFPTLPDFIVHDTISSIKKQQAIDTHTLFTEMSHGYIDPVSAEMISKIKSSFNDSIWSNESGYEEYPLGVFNEYMTWASYDLFLDKFFPEYGKEVGLYWHYQNDSRGFEYSNLFAKKLKELYGNNKENITIKDNLHELLVWTDSIQNYLTKPRLVFPKDSLNIVSSVESNIKLQFSERMEKTNQFQILLRIGNQNDTLKINSSNNLKWSDNGESVSFSIKIPKSNQEIFLGCNWWGIKYPLISEKGVLLKNASRFRIVVN